MSVVAPDLRELRADLKRLREVHPRRSAVVMEAFNRLVRAADAAGQPLDALRTHTRDEVERFFAQTIPGTDGHVYWDGARTGFKRNDRKHRHPRRWWWAHNHGFELGPYEDLVPTCGELNCINPEHCEVGRGLRRQRQFPDEAMLNAIKVAALRLGRPPTFREWDTLGLRPSASLYKIRFGSWQNVIAKAGLEYERSRRSGRPATANECIHALRYLRDHLGHWPSRGEFQKSKDLLHAADLPSSLSTVTRHLSRSWPEAQRKAGRR